MRFGLFCSPKADAPGFRPETGRGFFDYLEFNVEAEALGFHSSFSVEHHFSGWNQVSSTLMLLSALAMRTRTLRLGTAVIVPPWHNPVLLAEEAATLDLLSWPSRSGIGRVIGTANWGFQISPDEAEARLDEAVEVMTRAWTTQAFSHKGQFCISRTSSSNRRRRNARIRCCGSPPETTRSPTFARAASISSSINMHRPRRCSERTHPQGRARGKWTAVRSDAGDAARQLYVAKDKADKNAALARQANIRAGRSTWRACPARPARTCSPMLTGPGDGGKRAL
jgi:alkanesulfonate monooxygenase SsuD/methylene tetrahydromethanopterin reductase-like flavin-dependent oxidoreductase (luciferase family)